VLAFVGDSKAYLSLAGYIETNTLSLITIIRDSGVLSFYKNGVFINSTNMPLINSASTSFLIGDRSAGDRKYNGTIESISVYSRAATSNEQATAYTAGSGTDTNGISAVNLELFFDFARDSKTVRTFDSEPDYVYDLSGNANTGTVFGGVTLTTSGMEFDGSTGYIDTGLYPSNNWQMEINCNFPNIVGADMHGVETGNSKMRIGFNGTDLLSAYGDQYFSVLRTIYTNDVSIPATYLLSNGYLYSDGNYVTNVNYNWTVIQTDPIILGANIINGVNEHYVEGAINWFKVYTNNILIQHFDFDYRSKTLRVE